ncbi:MAG: lysylphosphatidylglycerol synthase domain-containing protein [Kofleriaceae bacterium]
MARPTIERTLRWLLWGAGILAFVWVLSRADLRATFPVFAAAGPVLFLALLPFLGQIALDALAWRALLGGLGHRLAWSRLTAIRLSTEAVLQSMPGGSLIGESLKPYLLRRAAAVPVSDTIASIATKRCLLALAQAGYLAVAVVAAHDLYARHSLAIAAGYLVLWILDHRPRVALGTASLGTAPVPPFPGGSS